MVQNHCERCFRATLTCAQALMLMQVASRDIMLNKAWVLITTTRRALLDPSSGTPSTPELAASAAECPAMNWSGVGQAEVVAGATNEAMAAVQHAAVRISPAVPHLAHFHLLVLEALQHQSCCYEWDTFALVGRKFSTEM